MKAIMPFLQWTTQVVLTIIFATILWGVELAWLICLNFAIVKMVT
jgi:hypothetical protein